MQNRPSTYEGKQHVVLDNKGFFKTKEADISRSIRPHDRCHLKEKIYIHYGQKNNESTTFGF